MRPSKDVSAVTKNQGFIAEYQQENLQIARNLFYFSTFAAEFI